MVLDSFQEDENINEIEDPSWVVDDAVFDGLIGPSNNIEAFEFLQKFNITNFEDAMENEIYDVEGIAYYYFVKVVAEEFVKLLKQFGWLEKKI